MALHSALVLNSCIAWGRIRVKWEEEVRRKRSIREEMEHLRPAGRLQRRRSRVVARVRKVGQSSIIFRTHRYLRLDYMYLRRLLGRSAA